MVYAYIRVSTKKQQQQGYSLSEQEQNAKNFAATLFQELRLYQDVESGTKNSRKGWQQLLTDLEKATSEDVIWYGSQSRLTRDTEEFQGFRKLIQSKGIRLFEKRQNRYLDFRNKGDRFSAGIMSLVDEEENTERTARIMEGSRAAWEAGNRTHTRIYGYEAKAFDPVTGNKIWTIVPSEAELIRYVFDLYVNKKMAVRGIVKKLNAEGYRNREGKNWNDNLRRMLTRSIYAGLTWNAERELIKSNLYEPIVTEKLYSEAFSRYKHRKGKFARGRLPAHLGTNFLRCPLCNVSYFRIKRHGKLYYLHGTYVKCKAPRKLIVYEIGNFILGEAYNLCLTLYADEILQAMKQSMNSEQEQLGNDILRVEAQIKKKQAEIHNLNEAIAIGATGDTLRNFVNLVDKRISDRNNLQEELQRLKEKQGMQAMKTEDLVASFSINNLLRYFDNNTTDVERRELLKPVILSALVHKDSIAIRTLALTFEFDYPSTLREYKAGGLTSWFTKYVNDHKLQGLPKEDVIKKWAAFMRESRSDIDELRVYRESGAQH